MIISKKSKVYFICFNFSTWQHLRFLDYIMNYRSSKFQRQPRLGRLGVIADTKLLGTGLSSVSKYQKGDKRSLSPEKRQSLPGEKCV
jgi:hypothetical protein